MQDEQLRGEFAHPDADLLTAFAEQALPARERDQVLTHLAQCLDCREVAALAGAAIPEPELVATTAGARSAAGRTSRSFWSWGPLRWTAAAATAAVVLSAVWLNHNEVQRQNLAAGTETNPAIVQTQSGPRAVEPNTLVSDIKAAPQVPASRAESSAKPEEPAKAKAASPKQMDAELVNGAAADAFTVNGAPANGFTAEKKEAATNNRSDQKDTPLLRARSSGQFDQMQAGRVSSNEPVAGPVLTAAADEVKVVRALPSAHPVASNNLAVAPASAPPAPEVTMSFSRQAAAELAPADQVAGSQVQASPARDAQSNVRVGPMATPPPTEQASLGSLQKSLAWQSTGMLWRVSSSGELQQSTDSGHNWRTALGEHPSKFRSVASSGAIVWAGGEDGALWSSLNNGVTWRKSAPSVEGHSPRGNVDNIRLAAPKNVTFRTSAGETWSSTDGGLTWTMKYE